jgi:hypothetical protein
VTRHGSEGKYDTSQPGDFDGLHWIVGNKPVGLVHFKKRYREPGLLAKKLGLNDQAMREVGSIAQ